MNSNGNGSMFKQFSSNANKTTNDAVNSTKQFLESNSLIGQMAFLLLVIFVYIILLRIGISILGWMFGSTNGSPKLINGMVDAKQLIVIPQDPSVSGAITINRSVNATDGIEFTWSVWIYIDDLTYNSDKYKCIFYKGNDNIQDTGLNFPNNAPGLYIAPNTNDLVIFMNTFSVINEQILIPDVPLNKWVNVIIRCENTTLDIYINGLITKSHILHGVPKQNYGDVYIAMNGGFSGYISNLWYYNYALGVDAIQKIAKNGPNTNMKGDNGMNVKNSNYLSLRWYFYGEGDEFNPTPTPS
jgi:hypothetical protein